MNCACVFNKEYCKGVTFLFETVLGEMINIVLNKRIRRGGDQYQMPPKYNT